MDCASADYVRVHVYRTDNAAASTATVLIQTSNNGTAWFNAATITNPTGLDATTSAGGEQWSSPPVAYTRVYVSAWTAGEITATCHAERAVD